MMKTATLPSDWRRNPGMALRTARYACFEHESLEAMIDVCPPENSEGLFEVDADTWAIAKLYTQHDSLEGVQFRDQREIESKEDMAIVMRELADRFYEDYAPGDIKADSRPEASPGVRVPDDSDGSENRTLDEF